MNSLTIPPSPNWYESNILACAPDNTLIYGARNDIVILEDKNQNAASNVRIIPRAHTQKVLSVNINKNWGQPRKLAVSVSEDKIIKVWDVESCVKLHCHNEHLAQNKVIGAAFAGEERVISVSEDGTIVIWNITLNNTKVIRELIGAKVTVTCISMCPHVTWLTAFGLKSGLVIVTDLRKDGKVLYKMRGHDKSVLSLSWCPVPINIFPKNPEKFVGQKETEKEISKKIISAELQDRRKQKPNYTTEEEFNTVVDKSSDKVRKEIFSGEENLRNTKGKEISYKGTATEATKSERTNINVTEKAEIHNDSKITTQIKDNDGPKVDENISDHDTERDSLHMEVSDQTVSDNCRTPTCSDIGREIIVRKEEEPRKEFLLASSAKEGNIYIWRAGTDGRMQTFFIVPNKSNNRKYKSSVDKIWITLCWVSPTILLSSSRSFELLAWKLPKPQDNSKLCTVIHKDHTSLLFSIAAPIILGNEFNWKELKTSNVWTTSQDRLLLNTNINSERTNLVCYPTFGGGILCLQLSPLDPNRLAISTTDGFIRIWDLSRPHKKSIVMSIFYQKIQSKVSTIAWHPASELLVAFGTAEGRIGYLDTNNRTKMPVLLPQYFKSQVYKIEWAPINGNKDNFGLYAVGEGRLVLFDIKSPEDPIEIGKPDNTFIYSLAWKPDYSVMLLTTKSGFIMAYTPDMKILCKHYFQHRINDIIWHPNAATTGAEENNWFATISNAKTVVVYNFNAESGNNDDNIVNEYQEMAEMINHVAWSPYEPSQLVMACDIGIVQIWDVRKKESLCTFINPNFESVFSVIWSPLDPDFIISGSKDNTLRVWRISEYPPVNEKEIASRRKKAIKEMALETTDLLPKIESKFKDNVEVKKPVKNCLLPSYYTPTNITQAVADLKKLMLWREKPTIAEANIDNNCGIDILNIFGSDQAMINFVSLNELIHRQKGKYNLNSTLSLFRGDISTSIKEAIEEKRVDLKTITLAPMVSPKLWQTACETYADQLSDESNSDPLEIATYYLACHKVDKAVNHLCDAVLFREALALAKCRLLGEEVVNSIIQKWAVYAVQTGNFEVAAQCYIFLGKYEEAASVLFRRTDLEILGFAVELAEKAGNEELFKAILFRYNAFKDENKEKMEVQLLDKLEVILNKSKVQDEILGEHHQSEKLSNDSDDGQQISETFNKGDQPLYSGDTEDEKNCYDLPEIPEKIRPFSDEKVSSNLNAE